MEVAREGSLEEEPTFSIADFPSTTKPHLLRHVTCAATSSKLILLGYQDGSVALFDVFGNPLDEHRDRHASSPVVAVALGAGSANDNVAASAAQDGTIRANYLFDHSARGNQSAVLAARTGMRTRIPHGITAIAIDPDYGKPRAGERVAYADATGRVVLFTSGWFGGSEVPVSKEPLLPVQAITWTGLLLAWSTDKGVHIFDTRLQRVVCFVEAPSTLTLVTRSLQNTSTYTRSLQEYTTHDSIPSPSLNDSFKTHEDQNIKNIKPEQSLQKLPANEVAEVGTFDDNSVGRAVRRDPNSSIVTGSGGGAANSDLQQPEPFQDTASLSEVLLTALAQPDCDWRTGIRLHVQCDDDEPLTSHGERTLTFYIAWPSVTKVIVVGPHIDHPQGTGGEIDSHVTKLPPRHVHTMLNIPRSDIPVPLPDVDDPLTVSPILSCTPFGDYVSVLIGTEDHRLVLARYRKQAAEDVRCTNLNFSRVVTADLVPIPGGEPLLLVLAQFSSRRNIQEFLGQTTTSLAPGNTQESLSETKLDTEIPEELELTSPPNVCFARALSVAEQIKWMLDQGRFEDALKAAELAPGGSLRQAELSIADVGHQFLESILSSGDYKRLADVLPRTIISTSPTIAVRGREKVMRFRRERWEHWITVFRTAGKLEVIAPSIPCHEPRMSDVLYNEVLVELAEANPVAMLLVLRSWPANVFDVSVITRAVETQSTALQEREEGSSASLMKVKCLTELQTQREALREALFMLYGLSGRHDETLNLLLQEKSDRVFGYIKTHDLYEAIRSTEAISGMYNINKEEATELLVNAPGTLLPPEAVVPILKAIGDREWLCLYLSGVFRLDSERSSQYHNMLLQLLVEFGRQGALYSFLKTSTHYSLDSALTLMGGRAGKGRGLFGRERVHVLATMGDLSAALDILLNELGDIHSAIDFASEHEDAGLWNCLIDYARGNADMLAALLDSPAGGKVNPVRLIPLISSEMEIPHLRDRLHRILVDAALERALREDTAAALNFDAGRYMAELDDVILRHLQLGHQERYSSGLPRLGG